MRKLSLVSFVFATVLYAELVLSAHGRYIWGHGDNNEFGGDTRHGNGLYQTWKGFGGVDKRFLFGRLNDRFGSGDGRFIDWSQLLGVQRTKKDFGSAHSDDFGSYKAYPVGRQQLGFNNGDFSKKSNDANLRNDQA